jgi:hypothetical protein
VKPNGQGDVLVHSFAGDDPITCLAYVRRRLGLVIERRQGNRRSSPPSPPKPDHWHILWKEACHPRGTPVEVYLTSRGLPLPAEAAGEALRFHASCPFGPGRRTPAMLALVRDIRSNEAIGVHRTALDLAGRKIEINGNDRMALGKIKDGVVKLTPDEDVAIGLAIGEGIETTLSLKRIRNWGGPIWACLNASNLGAFPVLGGIDALVVAVDNDETGITAAAEVIRRWHEAGRETMTLTPSRLDADLNDIVKPEVH